MEEAQGQHSFADLTIGEFIEALSSGEPVPGGGSASAIAGALGAALVSMVATLSEGRQKYEAYAPTLERAKEEAWRLKLELLDLADRDAQAYAGYGSALRMPRDTDEQRDTRKSAIEAAARVAAEVPLQSVLACVRVVEAAESLAGRSNLNAASDVLVAAFLGEAAARGAAENVRINLPATGDQTSTEETLERLDAALHDITEAADRTREAVLSGHLREPEVEPAAPTEPEYE